MDKPPACRILRVFYILRLNFFWSQIRICPAMKIFDLTLQLKSPTISFFPFRTNLEILLNVDLSNFGSEGVDVMWDVSRSPQSISQPPPPPPELPSGWLVWPSQALWSFNACSKLLQPG